MVRRLAPAASTRARLTAFVIAIAGCIAAIQSGNEAAKYAAAAVLTIAAAWVLMARPG
jgi:hypothetical protein